MKIIFFSHYFYPHIGGVEKHVLELSKILIKQKHEVTIITEKFDDKLKGEEVYQRIKIIRFKYPKQRYIGLIYIWKFIFDNRKMIFEANIIHIHDVFIWYLPFKFLYPDKKFFVTIHGLEWSNPFSPSAIWQKKLAVKFAKGSIGVGKFLEKYIGCKCNLLIYGAANIPERNFKKMHEITFIGRLSKDTGILNFLKYLKTNRNIKVNFVGDGELKEKCKKYGKIYGFTDPIKFLQKSEYIVPGGYLACLEAFVYKAKVKVFWDTKLKEDYWKMSPIYKFIENKDTDGAYKYAKENTYEDLAGKYLQLWQS